MIVVGVTARVQDLQADAAALGVDGIGDDPMTLGLGLVVEYALTLEAGALAVGEETTRDHQAYPATGTFGIEGGHTVVTVRQFLEPGVHRSHQDAVGQFDEAEIERSEEMWVGSHRPRPLNIEKAFSGYGIGSTTTPGISSPIAENIPWRNLTRCSIEVFHDDRRRRHRS